MATYYEETTPINVPDPSSPWVIIHHDQVLGIGFWTGFVVVSSSRPRIIADDHLAGMYRNSV